MAIKYSTEEANLTLAAQVIRDLWARNLVGHDLQSAASKLARGYVNNQAGLGSVVLLTGDGGAAAHGAQGLHPRRFQMGTRVVRAIGLADYVVDAEHRTLGPALMLLRRSNRIGAERFDLTYGLPNMKAEPVFNRAGMKSLGALTRFAKPLGARERLTRYMPGPVARSIAPVVDGALGVGDLVRDAGAEVRLECSPVSWDDPLFDDLWDRRPPTLLLAERTATMLRWRFESEAATRWQVCAGRDRGGNVMGYVVWRSTGILTTVGDFFTSAPDTLTAPLLLAFSRFARRAGMQVISADFFGWSAVAAQLRAAGMVVRERRISVFVGSQTPAEFSSPERWYLTDFDNDAD